jgi:hypothetical protein
MDLDLKLLDQLICDGSGSMDLDLMDLDLDLLLDPNTDPWARSNGSSDSNESGSGFGS